jgi:hypothetical protein
MFWPWGIITSPGPDLFPLEFTEVWLTLGWREGIQFVNLEG